MQILVFLIVSYNIDRRAETDTTSNSDLHTS